MAQYLSIHKINKYVFYSNELAFNIKHSVDSYSVFDSSNVLIFKIKNESYRKILLESSSLKLNLEIMTDNSNNINRGRKATHVEFYLDNDYLIIQDDSHKFYLYQNNIKIGEINDILKRKSIININDDIPIEIVLFFYTISLRMIQEEDLDIV